MGNGNRLRAGNPNRAHQLEHLIREGIAAADLESQVSPETSPDFATLASRIHAALGLLRNTHMEDGMHVFGETPQGKRRAQFIASIVRYDAGQADSLRKRLCTAQGFELETLLAEPGGVDKRLGQSHASLLEKVEKQLVDVCEILMKGKDPEALRMYPLPAGGCVPRAGRARGALFRWGGGFSASSNGWRPRTRRVLC